MMSYKAQQTGIKHLIFLKTSLGNPESTYLEESSELVGIYRNLPQTWGGGFQKEL